MGKDESLELYSGTTEWLPGIEMRISMEFTESEPVMDLISSLVTYRSGPRDSGPEGRGTVAGGKRACERRPRKGPPEFTAPRRGAGKNDS